MSKLQLVINTTYSRISSKIREFLIALVFVSLISVGRKDGCMQEQYELFFKLSESIIVSFRNIPFGCS